jgi:2-aminoethylphosphonate-pyruvate transaminase
MIKQAVIMAGGLGSRFGGRTTEMPKGFIEIEGVPMVELSVQKLIEAGIEKIIIGTGHCSEWYDRLAEKYSQIKTVKNENYINTSSMGTLEVCAPFIDDSCFLLESDLIYDKIGLAVLNDDERQNVILASGKSNSHDEVYLGADDKSKLTEVSKDKTIIPDPAGELVGITKVSKQALTKMCTYYDQNRQRLAKLDYEGALKRISTAGNEPVYVRKIEYYAWTEIDDEAMLDRALNKIYPRIKENEYLYSLIKN